MERGCFELLLTPIRELFPLAVVILYFADVGKTVDSSKNKELVFLYQFMIQVPYGRINFYFFL